MDNNVDKTQKLKVNNEIYVDVEEFVDNIKVEKKKELTKEQRKKNFLHVTELSEKSIEPLNIMNKDFRENLKQEVKIKMKNER